MYRLIVESLLGLRLETDRLYIEPCLPSGWDSYKIHYRYRETIYHISICQLYGEYANMTIRVDGTEFQDKFIRLYNDRNEHQAEVKLFLKTI